MQKTSIWLSYDLGIRGDYESLYSWLDDHQAEECGDSVAYLKFDFESDLISELKADLEKNIEINRNVRIYVIFHKQTQGKPYGKFLFGNRRRGAWEGRGTLRSKVDVDEG
jgi:hypothetical protein